jgi:hypothetical protein
MELWVHYLIADTGNRRIIELIDRYVADPNTFAVGGPVLDANGDPQFAKLLWHTPENFSGKEWQYTAIQRFQVGLDPNNNAKYIYIAGIGDMMPTRVGIGADLPSGTGPRETGGGAGGIMIFDSATPAGNQVINEINVNGVRKHLSAINSISVRPLNRAGTFISYAIMFTDATGVYEIAKNGTSWDVIWMMPNNVYQAIRHVKLRAVAAKRLANGDVLITNDFNGQTDFVNGPPQQQPRDFFGEITQWSADAYNVAQPNFGFSMRSIRFELPPVVGSRSLRSPEFADRR